MNVFWGDILFLCLLVSSKSIKSYQINSIFRVKNSNSLCKGIFLENKKTYFQSALKRPMVNNSNVFAFKKPTSILKLEVIQNTKWLSWPILYLSLLKGGGVPLCVQVQERNSRWKITDWMPVVLLNSVARDACWCIIMMNIIIWLPFILFVHLSKLFLQVLYIKYTNLIVLNVQQNLY